MVEHKEHRNFNPIFVTGFRFPQFSHLSFIPINHTNCWSISNIFIFFCCKIVAGQTHKHPPNFYGNEFFGVWQTSWVSLYIINITSVSVVFSFSVTMHSLLASVQLSNQSIDAALDGWLTTLQSTPNQTISDNYADKLDWCQFFHWLKSKK